MAEGRDINCIQIFRLKGMEADNPANNGFSESELK